MPASAGSLGAAVVTGAGGGLGAQVAKRLAAKGFDVLVTDVDLAAAEAVATALRESGANAFASVLDVTDPDACRAIAREAVARTGALAVWVNNAGILATGPVWSHDDATRRAIFEVNALGTMHGTIAALEVMRALGRGHVVNIASLAGLTPVPGESVYAATKHAVLGLSLSTLADLRIAGERDVHISCICPDGMWTPMLHDRLDDPGAALSFSGTLLTPERVADVVASVVDRPRPVTAVPRWRGGQVRVLAAMPRVSMALAPHVVRASRRLQRRAARRIRRQATGRA
jgi:short-subunit dehydrogenase